MKKKNLIRSTILLFISLSIVVFILWHASRPGEESRVISDTITNAIKDTIESNNKVPPVLSGTDAINKPSSDTENKVSVNTYIMKIFIRKSGHLLAYTGLSFFVALTAVSFGMKKDSAFFATLFFSGIVALSDELIQSFTEERSGKFRDVLIDLCGCIMGCFLAIFVFLLLYYIIQRQKNNKKIENCKKISEND